MSSLKIRRLDNGLRVVMEPVSSAKSVSVSLWLGRGSRHESDACNGMTHFAEHLMFKGSKSYEWTQISRILNLLGGGFNAVTSTDWVKLYARVIRRDLEQTLEVISQMFLHSTFPEQEVARERSVILEEILQYDDIPDDLCFERFSQQLLLPHPIGRPVIGTEELVTGFTRDALMAYWEEILDPALMVLSVAGDFDEEETLRLADSLFGKLASGRCAELAGMEPAPGHSGREFIDRDIEQVNFCLGVTGPRRRQDERFAWALYDSILGGGMGSRLFDEIRERRGLAYSVGSNIATMHEAGYLAISGSTRPESAAEAMTIALQQIDDLATTGPRDDEMEMAKRQLERATYLAEESTSYRAVVNGERELYQVEHMALEETLRRLEAVTSEEVLAIGRQVKNFGPPALCVVGPLEDAKGLEELFAAGAAG